MKSTMKSKKPNSKQKRVRKGRPRGSKNVVKRQKRSLTPVQKLREHVLIELGLDKQDIADAIGTTRQTVSNLFYDEHRSEIEGDIVAFLRSTYQKSDLISVANIDGYFAYEAPGQDPDGCPITRESFGWGEKPAKVKEITNDRVSEKANGAG